MPKEVDVKLRCQLRRGLSFLVYLRQNPFWNFGLLFDVSKTKANDAFNYWIEILRDILPASQMEEVKGMSKSIKNCANYLRNIN